MSYFQNGSNTLNINSPVVTKTAAYTATQLDSIISVNSTSAAVTITLPAPSLTGATTNSGKTYYIKDVGGNAATNNITVTAGSANIDGSTTGVVIAIAYGWVSLYCDGTAYWTQSYMLTSNRFTWNAVSTAGPTSLVPSNGYYTTGSTAVGFSLPTSATICPVGSTFEVHASGTGVWTITGATGQTIRLGNQTSTATPPTLTSFATGDSVMFLCTSAAGAATGTFEARSIVGNLILG